jgi:serine/threonine protein kinase
VQAELQIERGADRGWRHLIKAGQRLTIGRGHEVAIALEGDTLISRRHAAIELREGRLTLEDLGSRNGTYLAGKRLAARTPVVLAEGDRFEVGNHVLRVVGLVADAGAAAPVDADLPPLPAEEFQLLGELGRGAMGTVHAARQRLLDRRVAVKVLRDEGSDEAHARLVVEGQTASRIRSPHVVQVHDIRLLRGRVCLIMELIDGPSVKDRLRTAGRLPLAEALKIAEHVALGLASAHAVGVVHRDVKPANILLGPCGAAKLTDFGIAKDLLARDGSALTDSNLGLGSLPYVAPEQAAGAKRAGPAADCYGLGATLYHLLSGRPPFRPTCPQALLKLVDTPPPPLADLAPDCPADVARLVHALLEKDPAVRPSDAARVARELHELRARHAPASLDEEVDAKEMRRTSAPD